MLVAKGDLCARVLAIRFFTVSEVVSIGPSSMDTIAILVVLRSLMFVVALNAAVVAIKPDFSITAFVVSELVSLSHANKGHSCKNS
jgi:hypothetical protein